MVCRVLRKKAIPQTCFYPDLHSLVCYHEEPVTHNCLQLKDNPPRSIDVRLPHDLTQGYTVHFKS